MVYKTKTVYATIDMQLCMFNSLPFDKWVKNIRRGKFRKPAMRIFEETFIHSSAFKRYTYLLVKGFFYTQLVKLYSINMAARNALKIGSKVKELRIHLCQKSDASKGVRDFIEQYYVNLKKSNPKFPILIRECSGVQPRVYARYELGKESSVPLSNLKAEEVLQKVELLAK